VLLCKKSKDSRTVILSVHFVRYGLQIIVNLKIYIIKLYTKLYYKVYIEKTEKLLNQ